MKRGAELGHCVCNRTETCPCSVLRERNICICAGETLPEESVHPICEDDCHVRSTD